MARIGSRKVVVPFLPLLFLFLGNSTLGEQNLPHEQMIQAIVTNLETRLQMSEQIEISIVPVEIRMLSVQRIRNASQHTQFFLISIDKTFLDGLTEQELTA